jgi:polyhydroxyalkanoate synthesis regulator phasin
MTTDTVVRLLQTSFRVTLGATASLVEILQDPQKREANLSRLKTDLEGLTQEWAEKGEVTELEARNYVDNFIAQKRSEMSSASTTVPTTATEVKPASPEVQLELQELTAQLAAIRAEVERLRTEERR